MGAKFVSWQMAQRNLQITQKLQRARNLYNYIHYHTYTDISYIYKPTT